MNNTDKIQMALCEMPNELILLLCAMLLNEHNAYNWRALLKQLTKEVTK